MRRAFLLILLLAAGCSSSNDPARFFPPEDRARQALESALTAWKDGANHGPVPGTANPVVQFADTHHPMSQRPVAFTIQGPAPGDGPRVFTVTLSLVHPTEQLKTRYVVFGQDPVWVVRHEDYDMIAHWEHQHGAKAPANP